MQHPKLRTQRRFLLIFYRFCRLLCFPVALEDKLLVVYSYISLPDEAPKPSKVEMMDLNGTNRRTLCELENGITLQDGAAASEKA